MQTLFTLCYPGLSDRDRLFIDDFRRQHDIPFRDVVKPHFTMVFGCGDVPLEVYREHVAAVAEHQDSIPFSIRYAMLGSDDSNEDYYVFLVPDEGYSAISKLHDRLYEGPLAPALRLDIPYIPHIGIATVPDAAAVKKLCDELNDEEIDIHGQINALTVSAYNGVKVEDLESFPFNG